jgi:hypothetical protein
VRSAPCEAPSGNSDGLAAAVRHGAFQAAPAERRARRPEISATPNAIIATVEISGAGAAIGAAEPAESEGGRSARIWSSADSSRGRSAMLANGSSSSRLTVRKQSLQDMEGPNASATTVACATGAAPIRAGAATGAREPPRCEIAVRTRVAPTMTIASA